MLAKIYIQVEIFDNVFLLNTLMPLFTYYLEHYKNSINNYHYDYLPVFVELTNKRTVLGGNLGSCKLSTCPRSNKSTSALIL